MAANLRHVEQSIVSERKGIRPELVSAARAKLRENRGDLRNRQELAALRQVGDDADEPVLGERTGGPSCLPVFGEPVVRDVVMDVTGIEQRDEHVHVEQRDTAHPSSSIRSTISTVRIRPGTCESTGTPLRTG